MATTFYQLCTALGLKALGDDCLIEAVTHDSRQAKVGIVFVACAGASSKSADGHRFIDDALAAGASAVIAEHFSSELQVPHALTTDSRLSLARAAEFVAGDPSAKIQVVGVTGTNGKTSVTQILTSALAACAIPSASLGTLGVRAPGLSLDWGHTTPEAPQLSTTLRQVLQAGAEVAAMEVSSHALALRRVDGLRFAALAFTNLSQDHLDFHGDMETYYQAKRRLFFELAPDGDKKCVVWVNSPSGQRLADELGARALCVGHQPPDGEPADLDIALLRAEFRATETRGLVRVDGKELPLRLSLLGDFNLNNALVALGLVKALGLDVAQALPGLGACPRVAGRMEPITVPELAGSAPAVLVDYAHTPEALALALDAVNAMHSGQTWVVFGAGGDRDTSKRASMGSMAAERADHVVLTDDNPRSEDPDSILNAIAQGIRHCQNPRGARPVILRNRAAAIAYAVSHATPQDLVLIAGKGHEDYQEIQGARRHFDDREQARVALRALANVQAGSNLQAESDLQGSPE